MQKILELREFEKKQAEQELGKAVAEETKIQNTLDLIAQQRIASAQSVKGVTDLYVLVGAENHVKFLDSKTEELLQQLTEAKLVTEQKREAMKKAMQNVSVLEKLRDARKAEWQEEVKRAEAKEIDDSNNSRYKK